MSESGFYDGVGQFRVPWRDSSFPVPMFYQDARMLTAAFVAPFQKVAALLPSKRLHPWRVTPWHCVVQISAFQYRACDIGPYNEVSISVPVTLDRPTPVFTGLLWPIPTEPYIYFLHLPADSEIACTLGVEHGGYPKFLADVTFSEDGDWVTCRVSEAGQHLLTLTVRKGQPRPVPRWKVHPISARAGRLLRALFISAEREETTSRNPNDARFELGDHRISQELRDLPLGQVVQYQYAPSMQVILTPVLESFAA